MKVVALFFDMRHFILDKHRIVPCGDLAEWMAWSIRADCEDQCRVGITVLFGGGVTVSTVFIGRDLGLGGLPLVFETMVFGGKMDEYTRRYSCWQDAEEGHEETVEEVRSRQLA